MNQPHRLLYRQTGFPVLQNRLFSSREAALNCATGDICLVQDCHTGLVRNAAFDSTLLEYDGSYHNEQEYSAAFQTHLTSVADLVERFLGKARLVEVGCGKGYFLELLTARGSQVTGFDPTYDGDSPLVHKSFVEPSISLAAEGVILRHVLEHVPDPVGFLNSLRNANGGRGRIYIEVPCFDWICGNRAWFDIFYEHVNYFRLEDFARLFSDVVMAGRLFGDQYLFCVAELESLRTPVLSGWTQVHMPFDFGSPEQWASSGGSCGMEKREAVWGCASKGVIFSLLRERAGAPIDVAIDINPKKHGMFLPGSGLEVLPPARGLAELPPGSTIYVMNPMYAHEIEAEGGDAYQYVCLSPLSQS